MTTPCTGSPPESGAASPGRLQESALITRLTQRLAGPPGEVWIGDDAAVVPGPTGNLVLAADALVAGVHFDLALVGLDDVGWKALAVNVSDMAAMGCRPTHALVTVCGSLGDLDFDRLYDGLTAAADEYRCPVVGGDLSGAPALMVAVAVAGDAGGSHPPPVTRSGARPDDAILVTGGLGASAAGLALLRRGRPDLNPQAAEAHRRPQARLHEGAAARAYGATAMIDISDGLAVDLRRLASASGVGVVLDDVPLAAGLSAVAEDAEAMALGGGEDYELLFTAPDPGAVTAGFAAQGLRAPLVIGRCTADPAERRLRRQPLPDLGWEHTW